MPALKRMIGDAAYGLRASQSHALLIGALVGLLGLTPGLRAQSAAPTDQAASKPAVAEKKKAAPELEPFDLSCVPAKAKSIMIFRPAAISRHRGMETSWEAVPLGPVLNLPVKGDEIEQVTSGFLRSVGAGANDVPGRPDSGFWVVRAGHDLDWKKVVTESCKTQSGKPSEWVNVAFEGRTYYKLRGRAPSPSDEMCFYFPDARTIVLAGEDCIRGVIRQAADSRPDLARAVGWQSISRSLIAAAWEQKGLEEFDEVSGMMMEIVGTIFPLRSKLPRHCYCGLDDHEIFRATAMVEYPDAREASRATSDAIGSLAQSKVGLAGRELDATHGMVRSMLDLGRNCQVRCNGRTVEIVSRCKMGLVDFHGYFGGAAAPAEGHKQARVEPGQRVTR